MGRIRSKDNRIVAATVFRAAMRLTLFLAAVVLFVRLFGGSRPPSLLDRAATNPDSTLCEYPCLFGIRPGNTSAEQARRLLASHPITRNGEWIADGVLKLPALDSYVVIHATPAGVVDSIGMTATMDNMVAEHRKASQAAIHSIMLGDYLLKFGVTDVSIFAHEFLVFADPNVGTLAVTARPDNSSQRIEPDTPITAWILSVVPSCGIMNYGASGAWKGFATVAQYETYRAFLPLAPSRFPMPTVRACRK